MTSLRADFHTHSTASDGTLAPAELIERSAELGLSCIALTDHDTTAGLLDAIEAGARRGVLVIPGIEFSADVARGELHILGYGIDPQHQELQERIRELRNTRMHRGVRILERLSTLGIELPPEILERDNPDDSLGRPHIARALVAAGVVESVAEGFDRYLAAGRPAFEPKQMIGPEEAIDLIHGAGGLAVMAHPFSAGGYAVLVERLRDSGLDGLECYYGEYSPEQREHLASLAREHSLLASGGSDFHGPGFREGRDLGSVSIPESVVTAFLDALGLAAR